MSLEAVAGAIGTSAGGEAATGTGPNGSVSWRGGNLNGEAGA